MQGKLSLCPHTTARALDKLARVQGSREDLYTGFEHASSVAFAINGLEPQSK